MKMNIKSILQCVMLSFFSKALNAFMENYLELALANIAKDEKKRAARDVGGKKHKGFVAIG